MPTLLADVRLTVRTLAKNRSFAAVAILTLALGVGANAAVFTVVNATILQPLPFAAPERLVGVFETARRTEVERRAVSYLRLVPAAKATRINPLAALRAE
jgi:hypothetical protein